MSSKNMWMSSVGSCNSLDFEVTAGVAEEELCVFFPSDDLLPLGQYENCKV